MSAAAQRPLVQPRLILGWATVLAGALLAADGAGLLRADSAFDFWPLGAIVAASVVAMQPGKANRLTAVILFVAGLWLLLNAVGIWTYSFWRTWPLLLVGFGAWMLIRTSEMRQRAGGSEGFDRSVTAADHLGAFAFLSQVDRRATSASLASGEFSAVLGGCRFDLTQAEAAAGPVIIEAFSLLGRIEITVPESWVVERRVLPLMGRSGGADAVVNGGATPDLVVQGTAILGDIEINSINDQPS